MKLMQKWLLGLALTGLLGGIFLTLDRASFPNVLAILLPLGASFGGLFLITFIFRNETAKFDAEHRLRIESARNHQTPDSEKPKSKEKSKDASEPMVSSGSSVGVVPKNPTILSSKPAA